MSQYPREIEPFLKNDLKNDLKINLDDNEHSKKIISLFESCKQYTEDINKYNYLTQLYYSTYINDCIQFMDISRASMKNIANNFSYHSISQSKINNILLSLNEFDNYVQFEQKFTIIQKIINHIDDINENDIISMLDIIKKEKMILGDNIIYIFFQKLINLTTKHKNLQFNKQVSDVLSNIAYDYGYDNNIIVTYDDLIKTIIINSLRNNKYYHLSNLNSSTVIDFINYILTTQSILPIIANNINDRFIDIDVVYILNKTDVYPNDFKLNLIKAHLLVNYYGSNEYYSGCMSSIYHLYDTDFEEIKTFIAKLNDDRILNTIIDNFINMCDTDNYIPHNLIKLLPSTLPSTLKDAWKTKMNKLTIVQLERYSELMVNIDISQMTKTFIFEYHINQAKNANSYHCFEKVYNKMNLKNEIKLLEGDINVPKFVLDKLTNLENHKDEIENYTGRNMVISFKTYPNIIFKRCENDKRYYNAVYANMIIKKHKFNRLVLPTARLYSVNNKMFIAEEKLNVSNILSITKAQYEDAGVELNDALYQLIEFIKLTGLSDITSHNIPILYKKYISLLDVEYMGHDHSCLYRDGYFKNDNGLLSLIGEYHLPTVLLEIKKLFSYNMDYIEKLIEKRNKYYEMKKRMNIFYNENHITSSTRIATPIIWDTLTENEIIKADDFILFINSKLDEYKQNDTLQYQRNIVVEYGEYSDLTYKIIDILTKNKLIFGYHEMKNDSLILQV